MENVPNIERLKIFYKRIVPVLIKNRKAANMTQAQLANYINIDRREVIAIESGKKAPLKSILLYADLISIDINFNFNIN